MIAPSPRRLIACASTMANLIPPSIMAVVYGAIGNVSIGGLFLAGIAPGFVVGIGLMIYSHFFGPVGFRKPRASLCDFAAAARASVLPMMIPVIIMGGILTGWFTPTEAGMIASVYILLVVVPLLNPSHIRHLPRDFVYTGLLYSIPLALVAAASAFGWMLAYLRGPDIVSGWIEALPAMTAASSCCCWYYCSSSSAISWTPFRRSSFSCRSSSSSTSSATSSRCIWAS